MFSLRQKRALWWACSLMLLSGWWLLAYVFGLSCVVSILHCYDMSRLAHASLHISTGIIRVERCRLFCANLLETMSNDLGGSPLLKVSRNEHKSSSKCLCFDVYWIIVYFGYSGCFTRSKLAKRRVFFLPWRGFCSFLLDFIRVILV